MDFKIAEYTDYERIATLHAQSWRRFYHGILGEDYLEHDVLDERLAIWQARLINPPFNQHVVLIEEGGLLCGFVCVFGNHDFEKGTMIDSLHVDENYRRRGVGLKLLNAVTEWCEQHFSKSGIYLEVMAENHQAIEFYEQLKGIQLDERLWNAPCGHKVPELVYSWSSPKALNQQAANLLKGCTVT
ncbi:GNAT family N-acetyltransferase [Vibrio genomosp. F10]|uniref:Histone acetyltransferase n=2 Tax=Vibrio genomosp. F10 TaxID=723171 RepID=A0A1B9QZX5_9VIBR|nr:GNAT family N-acetyltransferase [Vibrio genomosp. F10]OCH77064.1 histone acetyltransferase [Vibrio genomosp. F10]OEE37523.1 histone acetyltransferase [Vibrio genomosp. F10 str. ZF-129]OEE94493.1 histone acetyltransferase [Vibrio genomosp. F10 str. 9ZC157]OEE97267.1 histone acetyltransferase [Vibrio genomosp. F10 str. 9ZD137]OEF07543.1 histone acetyltransferase [Vibrio genomosp. F10 str. 9ZB36]